MNPKNRLLWRKRQSRLAHEGKLGAEQVCSQMDAAGRFSPALVSERRRCRKTEAAAESNSHYIEASHVFWQTS